MKTNYTIEYAYMNHNDPISTTDEPHDAIAFSIIDNTTNKPFTAQTRYNPFDMSEDSIILVETDEYNQPIHNPRIVTSHSCDNYSKIQHLVDNLAN